MANEVVTSFDDLVGRATGLAPYAYQRRLAEEGLPELLRVPTGAGKTLAATLPWLYRRRFHPDAAVRAATPRWLVFTLPMRTLVEQTCAVIGQWLNSLGLDGEVDLHRVMGGEGRVDSRWRDDPGADAVFVGTLDMLVSRALNRGYGESRFAWPIDFGLFNSGCHWVFDEVQLMGPALPTSRQLHGLRASLGTALATHSTWMSATVSEAWLTTVDSPSVGRVVELDAEDGRGPLARRLEATKEVHRLGVGADPRQYARELAAALLAHHRPGTRTIAVLNTVGRARALYAELQRAGAPEPVLLHSRFRPEDRARHLSLALAPVETNGPGRIVVSTQVLEAGVDVTATTLFTEAAPWPSIVQRAGRCNRDGEAEAAKLLWAPPPKPAPYGDDDVLAAVEALASLDGRSASPNDLGGFDVEVADVVHPVLRRRDLLGLFDTTPDLSGNDLDVGRFIRDADDLDALVAWRGLGDGPPGDATPSPSAAELCPVPVPDLRTVLRDRDAWRFDHLDARWVRCTPTSVRPGQVLIMRDVDGCYAPDTGWDPSSKRQVAPILPVDPSPLAAVDEATGDDEPTFVTGAWVALRDHLAAAEAEAGALIDTLAPGGLSVAQRQAAIVAARLHDIGKAHDVFQATMLRCAGDAEREAIAAGRPWAKSGGVRRARHERRHFRHELASALALLGEASVALDGIEERELTVYLVAAHHGRVRVGIRSLPDERPRPDEGGRVALGIWDGERLAEVEVPGARLPGAVLDLSVMELGDGPGGRPSWADLALRLRDRPDVGPFRLAFLEALVRLADWRASAARDAAKR